jgi:hypothetical protein
MPDPELAAAPASVFRFHSTGDGMTPKRLETWTLRALADRGVVSVVRMTPGENATWLPGSKSLYLGTATDDGKTLTLALAAGTDQLTLTCTHDKLDVAAATAIRRASPRSKPPRTMGPSCGHAGVWHPKKTTSIAVLSCKDPRFEAPMIFGPAPGIEYLFVDDDCELQSGGYRLIAADGAIAPAT